MSSDLPNYPALLIISDTGMYSEGEKVFAFGPVVKELEAMLRIFDRITWIGFNRIDQKDNASYLEVPLDKVIPVLLPNVGGKSITKKLSILGSYPKMWRKINEEISKHDFIHSRAPSNPAYIAMRLSKRYPEKQFWFKYAGSWVEPASRFYDFQRKTLKTLNSNSVVTVNGTWTGQPKNILAFENPCITITEWSRGKRISEQKQLGEKRDYCFVGGVNNNKGVAKIIDAWAGLSHPSLGVLHIVGDGPLKLELMEKAEKEKINVIFHGNKSKEDVHQIYEKASFIILPSASEGFPKVIGEAMNYGCIPIVSNVSCMDQYIIPNTNGYLLEEISADAIEQSVQRSLELSNEEYLDYNRVNHKLAKKFTYQFYLDRIQNELFTPISNHTTRR